MHGQRRRSPRAPPVWWASPVWAARAPTPRGVSGCGCGVGRPVRSSAPDRVPPNVPLVTQRRHLRQRTTPSRPVSLRPLSGAHEFAWASDRRGQLSTRPHFPAQGAFHGKAPTPRRGDFSSERLRRHCLGTARSKHIVGSAHCCGQNPVGVSSGGRPRPNVVPTYCRPRHVPCESRRSAVAARRRNVAFSNVRPSPGRVQCPAPKLGRYTSGIRRRCPGRGVPTRNSRTRRTGRVPRETCRYSPHAQCRLG